MLSVVYVDDSATGLNNGTSWANAYTSLQAALAVAAAPQEIRVGQGTYKPTATTDARASFALKSGVAVLGGYAGFAAPAPEARSIALYATRLSGDIGAPGYAADNSFHVVVASGTNSTAVLDGFTITGGNASGNSSNLYGGGMYNSSSSPTVSNCTFIGNSATCGGAMCNDSSSSPTLINCTFIGNSVVFYGGGIYNNSSSSPTLTNCTFTANSAGYSGSGIYNSRSSPTLTNCVLWGNGSPGTSAITTNAGSPVVTYCGLQSGGGVGGNIGADPQFVHNASPGPDGTWGTADDEADLRLRLTSPCVDAGKNSAVPAGITTDLSGNARFADVPAMADTGSGTAPLVDMGAYEAPAAVQAVAGGPYRVMEGRSIAFAGAGYSPTGLAVSYAWDFDGDGQFDDASGPTPVFSAAGMQGPQTLTVALRVTDTSGASGVETAALRVLRPLYVDDSAAGLNNGTSWADAYTGLQAALTVAIPGQMIAVAQGTYKPTAGADRAATFALRTGVAIYGGFAGYGAPDPAMRDARLYPSILSGDIGTAGSNADNCYHVVTGSGTNWTAVLDGFMVTRGNANGSSSNASGGGMYTNGGSPTVTGCTFIANSAADNGGGIYNSSSSPTLTNCTFIANSATENGGGMYNYMSSSPTVSNCTFTANSATFGGGTYDTASSSAKLTNCILWANAALMGNQIYKDSGTLVVTYSDIQGGYSGAGNINLDPQFVRNPSPGADGEWRIDDDDYGDLRLRAFSPGVDAGNNQAVPAGIGSDLAGSPRFADVPTVVDTGLGQAPLVDLGAYEVTAATDAEAGGPYAVLEGSQVTLHGQGAGGRPGALQYEWDFDADGQYDDAVGPNPTFSAAGIAGPQVLTVGLRVTDAASASVSDTAVVIVAGAVAYVDDTAAGADNGTSWADAYSDLQTALAMSAPGQTVRVAQGTYKPSTGTNRAASFVLRSGVALYGGYAGWGAAAPSARDAPQFACTLSGDIGMPGDATDNSYHVVVGGGADATAILEGFAITGGNANGSVAYGYDLGGGLYNDSSSPTLSHCTFTANSADNYGGGMYNTSSSPTLTNCTFTANAADSFGGGLYNTSSSSPTLTNCTFSANSARDGGAMHNTASSPTLTDCTFTANSANNDGGGVYNASSSSPTATNCTFAANSANGDGGGMYNDASSPTLTNCTFTANSATSFGGGLGNDSSSPTLTNCTFTANSAGYQGGGMYNSSSSSPTLTNCTFATNSAGNSGGGMHNASSSSATLTNCTFTANSAGNSGGGMYNDSSSSTLTNCTLTANAAGSGGGIFIDSSRSTTLTNCILWANMALTGSQIYYNGGTLVVTYSDIQGGYIGAGNIDLAPQFVRSPGPGPDAEWGSGDDDCGDLRLRPFSPAVDAGNNAAVSSGIGSDLAGNPRFADAPTVADTGLGQAPIVDLGAYEAVANVDAEAGGPYAVLENGQVTLHGQGAGGLPGALQYEWDFDGDGQYDDAIGSSPTFSAASLAGPQVLTIGLRVTDAASASAGDTAVVIIAGAVAYVDDTAVGANNGTSWTDAFRDLQWALALSVPGQVIRVAQGTYKPTTGTSRGASFVLRSGVTLYGGYAGWGAADPFARNTAQYVSTLSGDLGRPGDATDNSFHVVVSGGNNAMAVLDGFAITGGNANGNSVYCYDRGGGMCSYSSPSPTLRNCTFAGNSALLYGGGMYNYQSSPTLTNCTFIANAATRSGGGMYNDYSSPTLSNCTFTANATDGQYGTGGGIYNDYSSPTLTNCAFTANAATSSGGGMCNDYSSPTLTNCAFIANLATQSGGGMDNGHSSPRLTNCTFTANSATDQDSSGGGMCNDFSSPTLTNCTFTANLAGEMGGGMRNYSSSPRLTNCILWANEAPSDSEFCDDDSRTPVVTYSDIQGGYSGAGNINLDPHFVRNPSPGPDGQWRTADDDYGDLRLRPFSPAVDAGNKGAVPAGIGSDLAGSPRFADVPTVADTGLGQAPIVDLGAYEAAANVDAEAGGPYAVPENGQVTLHGQGAGGQPGALQYEWDFDADGQYDDAVGPTPTFSAAAIAGPRGLTVGLRVTDAALASASDTAVVIVAGAVAYVDDTAAGADYGTSWADAFRDLQSALAMSVPGQVIRVAQGTYKPTTGINRAQSFVLRSGVVLQGGYAGWGAADPSARDAARYVSTLSGDVGRPNDATDNSFHVVVGGGADATAVLDGFTVSGGNADGDHAYGYDQGGGVYNDRSSPTLSNCTFRANSARYGGAMYNDSSSPKLTDCTLVANSADYYGGGMYNDTSSPTLADCAFIANSTGHYGGGMCNAWSSPTLINCAFAANSAKNSGGGMYNESSSSPTLTNCILWANTASSASQVFTTGSGAPVVTYCDLQGGYSGAGNIDLDPQFVRNPSPGPDGKWRTADDDYGDVRLRQNSPCIDGGDNAAVPTGTTTDLAGNPRFVDVPGVADTGSGTPPIVDMGAYESPNPNLVVGGTDGPDEFSLGLSPDQSSIRIVAPGMSNTYSVLAITAITVSGAEGDDRLTVDFANGNPVPAGGVTFDGQGGSDGVCVVAPDNNATLTGEQVSVGTAAPIGSSNIEGTSFHLGTGKLTKCGSGTATVVGGSVYTGGTEVLGGTLLVGDAHALPTGGSLTIGAGATVVLPSGRSQAVVAERGNAVLQGPAGGGPWQADSGAGQADSGAGQADSRPWQVDRRQWTVHCPLSTAYGPRSPCLPGPETAPARKSLADFSAGALSFAPAPRTAVAPDGASETPVRSADLQACKEVALLAAGQQAVKKKASIQQAVDRALAALWPQGIG